LIKEQNKGERRIIKNLKNEDRKKKKEEITMKESATPLGAYCCSHVYCLNTQIYVILKTYYYKIKMDFDEDILCPHPICY
jgi:hypothetical protein